MADDDLRSGAADVALVQDRLAGLGPDVPDELNLSQPRPTAAFSRRDQLRPRYNAAVAAAATHGYAAIVRPVGGHLAAYDEGSLVLHLWARHPEPREHIRQRFALVAGGFTEALRSFGVDAGVGPVPGEYCAGEFSVNDGGQTKLVGTGQRIVRAGYLFSAVVMVRAADRSRRAMVDSYAELGLPFDPRTVGCVADSVPEITVGEVRGALVGSLGRFLDLRTTATRPGGASLASTGGPRN